MDIDLKWLEELQAIGPTIDNSSWHPSKLDAFLARLKGLLTVQANCKFEFFPVRVFDNVSKKPMIFLRIKADDGTKSCNILLDYNLIMSKDCPRNLPEKTVFGLITKWWSKGGKIPQYKQAAAAIAAKNGTPAIPNNPIVTTPKKNEEVVKPIKQKRRLRTGPIQLAETISVPLSSTNNVPLS